MATRRKLLATMALLPVAGCTTLGESGDNNGDSGGYNQDETTEEPDSDGDGVPDSEDDFPNDSSRSVLLDERSETLDLNEDYYQHYEFKYDEATVLSYEVDVQSDVHIDVILTDETNFRYFEDETEWEYYSEGSDLNTVHAEATVGLQGGKKYYLIIDNTNQGGAEPPTNLENDRVEVKVEMSLSR